MLVGQSKWNRQEVATLYFLIYWITFQLSTVSHWGPLSLTVLHSGSLGPPQEMNMKAHLPSLENMASFICLVIFVVIIAHRAYHQ